MKFIDVVWFDRALGDSLAWEPTYVGVTKGLETSVRYTPCYARVIIRETRAIRILGGIISTGRNATRIMSMDTLTPDTSGGAGGGFAWGGETRFPLQ